LEIASLIAQEKVIAVFC